MDHCINMLVISDADLLSLIKDARRRKQHAFRPGTVANHRSQFALYLSFCVHYNLPYVDPSPHTVCLYTEFLARSFSSPRAIRNYVSGIRLFHKLMSKDCAAVNSFEVSLILRALDLTMQHTPKQRLPIDSGILSAICSACNSLGALGVVCKVAFLFGYFGFLRQSNLAPKRAAEFQPKRHTCRGDILLHPPGIVIILKWSKTIQRGQAVPLIPLPRIPGSPLCPLQAYNDMLQLCPTVTPNTPLLQLPGHQRKTVTIKLLGQVFHAILDQLGYPAALYSLHSLRAGGATAAFNAGVEYTHIKRHGTWKSDCFWSYVSAQSVEQSPVAKALAATC